MHPVLAIAVTAWHSSDPVEAPATASAERWPGARLTLARHGLGMTLQELGRRYAMADAATSVHRQETGRRNVSARMRRQVEVDLARTDQVVEAVTAHLLGEPTPQLPVYADDAAWALACPELAQERLPVGWWSGVARDVLRRVPHARVTEHH